MISRGDSATEATGANAATMTYGVTALKKPRGADRYIRSQQISVEPPFVRTDSQDSTWHS